MISSFPGTICCWMCRKYHVNQATFYCYVCEYPWGGYDE